MATLRKRGNNWEVQVYKKGIRKTSTFPTKAQAQNWASATEAEIIAGKVLGVANKTFGDLLDHYAKTVSPQKQGTRWEIIRIEKFRRDPIAEVRLEDLSAADFAQWRDRRLKEVQAGSVLREWNLLSNALKRARDEWRWMDDNPLKPVAKPKKR